MDLIAQALTKRDRLKAELERIEAFLGVAYELKGEVPSPVPAPRSDSEKADLPAKRIVRSRAGIGAETADAAVEILTEAKQDLSTRDLAPLIEAKGIELSGQDKVATLSARLSNAAKREGKLVLRNGKWGIPHSHPADIETADTPTKDASAASFFTNQEGGETYAAPLN